MQHPAVTGIVRTSSAESMDYMSPVAYGPVSATVTSGQLAPEAPGLVTKASETSGFLPPVAFSNTVPMSNAPAAEQHQTRCDRCGWTLNVTYGGSALAGLVAMLEIHMKHEHKICIVLRSFSLINVSCLNGFSFRK